MRKPCQVPECGRPHEARGLCSKHYQRLLRGGDVTTLSGKEKPDDVRFWEKVLKTDGCWLWRGGKSSDGYGHFHVDGRMVGAHRVAFALKHGRHPDGLVLHSCDTPTCVNPNHLREGTVQDNSDDMVARGRSTYGSRNPRAKLSADDVQAIRLSVESYTSTARRFSITPAYVWRIKAGINRSRE